MSWGKTQTAKVQDIGLVQVQRPKPYLVKSRPSLAEYRTVADSIGFMPAQLLEASVLEFVAANRIPVFDYEEVWRYLAKKAEDVDKHFVWCPLRGKDLPPPSRGFDWRNGEVLTKYKHGGLMATPYGYGKAVPMKVLEDVRRIEKEFPTMLFFISDYEVPNPDPFIMMTSQGIRLIVFGVWDEPDFGLEKEAENG